MPTRRPRARTHPQPLSPGNKTTKKPHKKLTFSSRVNPHPPILPTDDLKLGGVLKKMQLTAINGVEEVNIFKSDGNVIHIVQPKIQASIPSNIYVVSGTSETKPLQELLPGILHQLGPESMERLRQYAAQMQGGQPGASLPEEDEEEDDDDVPDLVENFEEAAK